MGLNFKNEETFEFTIYHFFMISCEDSLNVKIPIENSSFLSHHIFMLMITLMVNIHLFMFPIQFQH